MPFDESRRLTGYNLYFADVGAVLETVGVDIDEAMLGAWRARVQRMRDALGWPAGACVARVHAKGASLALAAPLDQLFAATEVDEWAWSSAVLASRHGSGLREQHIQMQSDISRATLDVENVPSPQPLSLGERGRKLPLDEEQLAFVRGLRQSSSDAEQMMWFLLRDRRLHGQKFRRQHAISRYVLDFYCHDLKLAIELDGGQHNRADGLKHDARRDAFMAKQGVHTLRYWNHDVMQRTEEVLADIWHVIEERLANENETSVPSPGGREVGVREHASAGHDALVSYGGDLSASADVTYFPLATWEALHAPGHAAAWDEDSALQTLQALARAERNPALTALVQSAQSRGLTVLIDDDLLSIGVGGGSRAWPLAQLPADDQVDWSALHDAPVALVTGSNGKTTTTRLLAALARAHGWRTAHTSTDGVFVGATALAAGDYSGPAGARVALREPGVDAAILETARGGILRRGIAVQHADVAVVTNVSDDHFGEYGVHDLDDLVAVKLVVARTLGERAVLVANADDAVLVRHAQALPVRLAWFAFDADAPLLQAHRTRGGATCGVRHGHLWLHGDGVEHDLGAIAAMPLSFGGAARYNVANIAAAALAAHALGLAPTTLRAVLARFGAAPSDNPGRLQHALVGGIDVFVDYAHNPDGLRGLLEVATHTRKGRLGLLLGQAGNREDAEIRELAAVAAQFSPDHVVLKDIGGMLRGRAVGDVPAILRESLLRNGIRGECIDLQLDEFDAVRAAFAWARPGDTLVLPVHGSGAKPRVGALLEGLLAAGWQAGMPLPPIDPSPAAAAG